MRNKNWEKPVCNLCGKNDQTILYKNLTYWEYPGIFQIVKCNNCSLIFVSPRPRISDINKYYEQENYFGRDINSERKDLNYKQERKNVYENVYKLILNKKTSGKILDIGAGTGLFLTKFKDLNWKIDGVELSRDAVLYARKQYDIKLKQGDFFDFSFSRNSYDVIALNGALEHLYNPQETLKKAYSILKTGGIIVFTVPNVESLGNKIFGRRWFPWQPPRHLYHFSPTTTRRMLNNSGFKKINIYHNYWLQNYYILFQSLRYGYSPKFVLKKTGGLKNSTVTKNKFYFKKEFGKIAGKIFAFTLSLIEPMIKRGEVLIVYAKK